MKKATKLMVSLIACAAVMQAATAEAEEAYLEVRSSSTNLGDGELMPLIDAESSHGVGVALGYELDIDDEALPVIDGVRVLGNYGFDTATGDMFAGDVSSRWDRHRLMAGADVGIDTFGERVRPLVRLGAGYSRQSLTITADQVDYGDIERGFIAEAGGGLEVLILTADPEGPNTSDNLSIGANLLVGYTFQPSANFDEMERRHNGEAEFDYATYDAGSMRASGLTVGIGFVGSYHLGR